jgi:hypothetical protein
MIYLQIVIYEDLFELIHVDLLELIHVQGPAEIPDNF